jgi:hypothetical protein
VPQRPRDECAVGVEVVDVRRRVFRVQPVFPFVPFLEKSSHAALRVLHLRSLHSLQLLRRADMILYVLCFLVLVVCVSVVVRYSNLLMNA